MATVQCNISNGNIAIRGSLVECNGASATSAAIVQIFGSTTRNSVSATDSNIQIELQTLLIQGPTPFTANSSTIAVWLSGNNSISAMGTINTDSSPAIQCRELSNLTFIGLAGGSLRAVGARYGPGIGAGSGDICSTMVFVNGTLDARSGYYGGAGIGSGSRNSTVFNLMISGGNISASGSYGAGIGSGYASPERAGFGNATVFHMTISGGNINTSGSYGAGIGSGYGSRYGSSTVVRLGISGGTINASGSYAAGIGSGHGSGTPSGPYRGTFFLSPPPIFPLTISGGHVNARAPRGTSIGLGSGSGRAFGHGHSTVFDLTILGGNINASGSYAAGIGSGYGYGTSHRFGCGNSTVVNLTIAGGDINASGSRGAGIGSGYGSGNTEAAGWGNSTVLNLTISGGTINASASRGAGIGSGNQDGYGSSTVSTLTILGGNINTSGSNGAGIGSGSGSSNVSQLIVVNGSFRLRAVSPYAGIGTTGFSPSTDTVTIVNGFFDCSALNSTFCINSNALIFRDGSTTAITTYRTVCPSSESRILGFAHLYFEYLSLSSPEHLTGLPILHLESISFAYRTVYTLSIMLAVKDDERFERELIFNATRSRGCAFTVGSLGNYSIFFKSASPPSSGRLEHDGIQSFFAAGPYDTLYSAAPVNFPSESVHATATGSHTPPSTQALTPTSAKTPTSQPASLPPRRTMTRPSSQTMTSTISDAMPPRSEGDGISPAVIVVPIIVAILALAATVAVCWHRRRRLTEEEYQSMNESFLDVRID
jgi:hypothetical protein